jgi:AraC-like DNA-binding protein
MAEDRDFLKHVHEAGLCARLFEALPDIVFCLKDADRRYRAANLAFAGRLGLRDPVKLIGRRAEDFFPAEMAAAYRKQDQLVLGQGRSITDELELISNGDGGTGWFLATKIPLHDASGAIIGLASISRDLRQPAAGEAELAGIARVADHVRAHLDEPLKTEDLARIAGLTATQLDRRMRRVYHLTTAQFIRKSRIEHAAVLLASTRRPIAEIALECGYGDQTALTRQFRATVGMPPAAFREHRRKNR